MTDVRRRVNRAVAAVAEATGEAEYAQHSPLYSGERPYRDRVQRRPVRRYESYAELVASRRLLDRQGGAREALEALREPPPPRDEAAALPDAVWATVLELLGLVSADAAHVAASCRRLRVLALGLGVPPAVDVVPAMLPLERLSDAAALQSLGAFFGRHTRGQHVRRLAFVESRWASVLPLRAARPAAALPPALRMLRQLPALTSLDLRGVNWTDTAPQRAAASHFLCDLHLAAPGLATLKISVELAGTWEAGWWRRHPGLALLVVGSRRDQAQDDAAAPTDLDDDLFAMLSQHRQPLALKLWCPLTERAARRLLAPAAPHERLAELAVNLLHRTSAIDPEATAAPETDKKKGKKAGAGADEGEPPLFPALTAFTVANVHERPLAAVELMGRMAAVAPRLESFTVCNTVRIPPPEKPRGRKAAAAAAAASTTK